MVTSSNPDSRDDAGFLLLECMVSIIVMSLMVVGIVKITSAHEGLVTSLRSPYSDGSIFYIHRPADPLARALGIPAEFKTYPPLPDLGEPRGDYEVKVMRTSRDLYPPKARAIFERRKKE